MTQTSKKLKLVGTETYINSQTGEVHEMQVVEIDQRDAHFQKLWVGNILSAVEALSSKRLKIVLWLVQESSKHRNIIPMTVRQMAEELEVSTATLNRTLQILEEHDIIRREPGRVWMNPTVVYKGSSGSRMEVLTRYRSISKEEEIRNEVSEEDLEKEEAKLMKRLEQLRSKKQELQKQSQEAAAE